MIVSGLLKRSRTYPVGGDARFRGKQSRARRLTTRLRLVLSERERETYTDARSARKAVAPPASTRPATHPGFLDPCLASASARELIGIEVDIELELACLPAELQEPLHACDRLFGSERMSESVRLVE